MIVWHVTTRKKLERYHRSGGILPPCESMENSRGGCEVLKTNGGRKVILRLKFPKNAEQLPGHKGMALVLHEKYKLTSV